MIDSDIAQTNIRLINQLHRDGYAADDLRLVASAYRFGIQLFSGQYRSSGKTFLAHLVGTASILAHLRLDATVVAAGLLHAAYQSGDFGDRGSGMTDSRREQVRTALQSGRDGLPGADIDAERSDRAAIEAESLIARYQSLRWGSRFIDGYLAQVATLDTPDRQVLLMRLANELEEHLDLGILYHGDVSRKALARAHGDGGPLIEMANALGQPGLADSLAHAFRATASAEADFLPGRLAGGNARNHSYTVAPRSFQRIVDSLAARRRVPTNDS